MRQARIVITALTLLVTSLSLPGCATARGAGQLAEAAPSTTKKKPEDAAVGRLDDPGYLFGTRPLAPAKSVRVKALAYTGCSPKAKTKRTTKGAWGDVLTRDAKAVAVSPDLLDMGLDRGDLITIEGLGQFKVLDIMHGRHDKTIDIFYGDDACGAVQWGKRTLTITWQ